VLEPAGETIAGPAMRDRGTPVLARGRVATTPASADNCRLKMRVPLRPGATPALAGHANAGDSAVPAGPFCGCSGPPLWRTTLANHGGPTTQLVLVSQLTVEAVVRVLAVPARTCTGGAEPYPVAAVTPEQGNLAMGERPMPQARSQIVERLRSALQAQYDAILNEPLPERWVDLIHRLNEQERREREPPVAPTGRPRPS
jgi:hypothetical protein